jgi:protein-tyrosine phosphatase
MMGRTADVSPVGRFLLPNLRDVGGYPTRDGLRVRERELYRSSAPVGSSEVHVAELVGIGLRSVFDLRSADEQDAAPDVLPDGTHYTRTDVLQGTSGLTPVDQERLMADPAAARRVLERTSGYELAETRFRDLVRLAGARRGLRTIFVSLTDDTHRPALIHCSTGRDRTGWVIAALLSLLDVPHEQIVADYMVSAELLEPINRASRNVFLARGGDGESFDSLTAVRPEYLDAAFDEVDRAFGTIERYFEHGLGIDGATQDTLRAVLLERASG